jgi:hypothetical protein
MMSAGVPTVFVVDDDVLVRKAIQGMLKSVGLRSGTFGTPELSARLQAIGGTRNFHLARFAALSASLLFQAFPNVVTRDTRFSYVLPTILIGQEYSESPYGATLPWRSVQDLTEIGKPLVRPVRLEEV